jgi:lysophospholipid acyltransferase (LPLAT)-like uncharacterized protein
MDRHLSTGRVSISVAEEKRNRKSKTLWKRIRQPLAKSRFAKSAIASIIAQGLRFVRLTNPLVKGSVNLLGDTYADIEPAIVALWHGQHLMAPVFYPRGSRLAAMVSRSADAELNAIVLAKFGIEIVRGSGGRQGGYDSDKGGAKALVALKKALDRGTNVCMFADIPHGTPRDSGLGIILLAKLSGRPILPVAFTTSRRKVLEKSWDKTTINLPFGRGSTVAGAPIFVPKGADGAEMERKRQELTDALNAATGQAYRMVDGPR